MSIKCNSIKSTGFNLSQVPEQHLFKKLICIFTILKIHTIFNHNLILDVAFEAISRSMVGSQGWDSPSSTITVFIIKRFSLKKCQEMFRTYLFGYNLRQLSSHGGLDR